MTATESDTLMRATTLDTILCPQYRGMSATQLLAHFRSRKTPVLFADEDPTQTTPELLGQVMQHRFCFNSECHELPADLDWRHNPSRDTEWQILHHKFYYLVGLARYWRDSQDTAYAARSVKLLQSWIAADIPAGFIAADVDARRCQNWIYAWTYLVRAPQFLATDSIALLHRLHADITWLKDNLHAKRNHRTLELYAIFLWAVAFPEFEHANALQRFALAELTENANSDFRPDGGHCEQSTHYHCIALKNFINVARLARLNAIKLDGALEGRLRAALDFAATIHRPDGQIPALSDADGGSYEHLLVEGERLLGWTRDNRPSRHFPDAGLVVLQSAIDDRAPATDRRFLILDAGPLGEGNHGHLDALTIEAYAKGSPIIVDPGRFTYDEGGAVNWRAAFRSTAAHSTVQIDGKNQARYEPRAKKWKITGPAPESHVCQFRQLANVTHVHAMTTSAEYEVQHHRHVFFFEDRYWLLVDLLRATELHHYDLRFQLPPELSDVQLTTRPNGLCAQSSRATIKIWSTAPGESVVEQGWVSRLYGEKTSAPRLRFGSDAETAAFATLIVPHNIEPTPDCGSITLSQDGAVVCFQDLATGQQHTVRPGFNSTQVSSTAAAGPHALNGGAS